MSITDTIRKDYPTEIKKTDRNIVAAFLSVGTGIFMGCIFYIFSEERHINSINNLFVNFNSALLQESSATAFFTLLVYELPIILLIFLLGTSIIGKPFISAAGIWKGSGIGFLSSHIYCQYGLKGLEYCLLIFYPGKIILLFCMMLAIKNALQLLKLINKQDLKNTFKTYSVSCLLVMLIDAVSVLLDFVLLKTFASLFSF